MSNAKKMYWPAWMARLVGHLYQDLRKRTLSTCTCSSRRTPISELAPDVTCGGVLDIPPLYADLPGYRCNSSPSHRAGFRPRTCTSLHGGVVHTARLIILSTVSAGSGCMPGTTAMLQPPQGPHAAGWWRVCHQAEALQAPVLRVSALPLQNILRIVFQFASSFPSSPW